jgi:Xaa-Pro dipeptidase
MERLCRQFEEGMSGSTSGEFAVKLNRLVELLTSSKYSAVVIGRCDNFAWLSCGGDCHVLKNSEFGPCLLVIQKSRRFLVANTMDCRRILEEELAGMGFEPISIPWYEESVQDRVSSMLRGMKAISDVPLPFIDFRPSAIHRLHYPLTNPEISRYRQLGASVERIVSQVATMLSPGIKEREIENLLLEGFASEGIQEVVGIIGSDSRIAKYRHSIASCKTVERVVMIAPAVQKWGLTVPITRMICFGNRIPRILERKYDALCQIESATMAACRAGAHFADILEVQKARFADCGYPDEWRKHYQGGVTGYFVNDPTRCKDPDSTVSDRQSFNWYITITGAKVEETLLVIDERKEIITSSGLWPVKTYRDGGEEFLLPQILIK